jgi:methionyl-tRNA formyltransferase
VKRFLVASSKPWHKLAFTDFVERRGKDCWAYVSTPEELKAALSATDVARYIFFLHWNWKVPQNVFTKHECICFHMTDLPYGRGGSPLQNLILAEKTETNLTAFRMTDEMDAGPVYSKKTMSLAGRAEEIYRRAGDLCWEMIDWIVRTEPTPQPQIGQATVFKRRTAGESVMPASGRLTALYDFIRMLDAPTYPRAYVDHGEFRYEFSHAEILNDEIQARVTIRRGKVE